MKTILLLITIVIISNNAFAQGGIGNKPRTDLVMLSAVARDSLSEIVFSEIQDLKRFAASNDLDSAALLIAYKDSGNTWNHAVNLADSVQRQYAADMLDKAGKLFQDFGEMSKKYYTVYKTKETPSGEKHIYQIVHSGGKKQRTISWVAYPIGDKLLIGSF